jgi:benzaldehyde dehydrogenase (NAD)
VETGTLQIRGGAHTFSVQESADEGRAMFLDESTWSGKIFIGGSWGPGSGGVTDVVEPATGSRLGEIGVADAADVAKAAEIAADAQREWAALPHPQRAAVLRTAGQLWAEQAEEISRWNVREVGAVPAMAGFAVHVAEQECYEAAGLPSRPYGELLASEQPRLSMARRVPAGVVGVISPFNVPIILGIRSVAPALALGNAVLLKPDPRTAVTGGVTIARIFEAAGLPPGVLQVLPGGVDVGEALVTHPLVRVIAFTGSTAAGRRVGELAGKHLKRAHLELGGNSALVVLDDADVDEAATLAAFGAFFHQGQICMTTGRHLVHDRVYDAFVERLAAKAANLPVGDPAAAEVALGPLIDAGQRDKIHDVVTSSIAAGAKVAAGGTYDKLFYQATVLSDVPAGARAFTEEIFGPVAPVTRFGSEDEAVRLAASSEYGLSLGIVTRDVMKGLALADRIPTGIVHINDQTVSDEANSPFGGVGASGTGSRVGGAAANIEAFTETRWVTMRSQPPAYPF